MTEQEFNKRVENLIANYNAKEAAVLEDAYHQILCFGIMLDEESMNNFEILLGLKAKYLNEV